MPEESDNFKLLMAGALAMTQNGAAGFVIEKLHTCTPEQQARILTTRGLASDLAEAGYATQTFDTINGLKDKVLQSGIMATPWVATHLVKHGQRQPVFDLVCSLGQEREEKVWSLAPDLAASIIKQDKSGLFLARLQQFKNNDQAVSILTAPYLDGSSVAAELVTAGYGKQLIGWMEQCFTPKQKAKTLAATGLKTQLGHAGLSDELRDTLRELGDTAYQAQALSSADYPINAFRNHGLSAVARMMETFNPEQLTSVLRRDGVSGDLIKGGETDALIRMLGRLNTEQQGKVLRSPYFLSNLVKAGYGDTIVKILQNLAPEQQSAILANNGYDNDRLQPYSHEKNVLREHGYGGALRKIEANIRTHEKEKTEKFLRQEAQEYDAQHGKGAYQKKYYPTFLDTIRVNATDLWHRAKELTVGAQTPVKNLKPQEKALLTGESAPQQPSPAKPPAQRKKPPAPSTPFSGL